MSTHLSCKKFYGLNGTNDLREKLILDYEKLYYRIYEIELYNKNYQRKDHLKLIEDYSGKLSYISYLFMYIYDMSIHKFVNLKKIEEKAETYANMRLSEETPENWSEIYENNNYESITF